MIKKLLLFIFVLTISIGLVGCESTEYYGGLATIYTNGVEYYGFITWNSSVWEVLYNSGTNSFSATTTTGANILTKASELLNNGEYYRTYWSSLPFEVKTAIIAYVVELFPLIMSAPIVIMPWYPPFWITPEKEVT